MSDCLVRLQVDHVWYGVRPIAGISLLPDPRTAAALRRFDLWWRYDAGLWALYSDRSGIVSSLMAGLDRALDERPLCLRFVGDLAHLASVTALPDGCRTVPHFSSRSFVAGTGEDAANRTLLPQSDMTVPPATIWLYPDDLTQASPDTTWRIRFDAARMPWMYFVVNRSQKPLNKPFMRTTDGHVLANPVETRLPDGDMALRFDTGAQAWSFSRVPTVGMGLFDRFRSPLSEQTTEICLIKSLPLPAPVATLWSGNGTDRRVGAATTIYL